MELLIIFLIFTSIAGGILIADMMIRFMFQHRVTDAGIDFLLFGKIPILHVDFTNVLEIKTVSLKESLRLQNLFSTLRFGIYGQGCGIVLLRLREGIKLRFPPDIFKRNKLFIFDNKAAEFVQEIFQHLPK